MSAAPLRSSVRSGGRGIYRLVTTYGSSRWATGPEIEAAGRFSSAGVFLGRLGGEHLRRHGREASVATFLFDPPCPGADPEWEPLSRQAGTASRQLERAKSAACISAPSPRSTRRPVSSRTKAAFNDSASQFARRGHLEAEPGGTGARSRSRRRIRCRSRQDGQVPAAGLRHGRSRPLDERRRAASRLPQHYEDSGDIDRQSSNWTTR